MHAYQLTGTYIAVTMPATTATFPFLMAKTGFPFECGLECEHFRGKKFYMLMGF